jgi:hypothetical protein
LPIRRDGLFEPACLLERDPEVEMCRGEHWVEINGLLCSFGGFSGSTGAKQRGSQAGVEFKNSR